MKFEFELCKSFGCFLEICRISTTTGKRQYAVCQNVRPVFFSRAQGEHRCRMFSLLQKESLGAGKKLFLRTGTAPVAAFRS